MASHLEIWRPSGRELFSLTEHTATIGKTVTIGKAVTNVVSIDHDATVSRLHAVLENHGSAWSLRDIGSRNGTYVNGEKVAGERVLRSGDEVRIGKSRLVFWGRSRLDSTPDDEATRSVEPLAAPPRLTPRELDVLLALCRPLVATDGFPEPASTRQMALELVVTDAAVKQHLQNMYDKFGIPMEGDRRVRLANEALRRGAVTLPMLREQR
ncbi:FHA domain-containing protein [Antrihabitans spumae]|uniref:FHA domain-containing protein n=1 Tax=Antrihabitans spumae TaxID=3373370 RepID=A0ABW7K6V1_9NOCA